jgi:undecaprenyl-diphosphatase
MELWMILVALMQGLFEWLPISSEGQIIFFISNFTPLTSNEIVSLALPLVVWLHLGTTLAVIARYPRTILDIISLKDKRLFRLLLIATIATAITGIPLYVFLRGSMADFQGETLNILVGVLLLVTAIVLYLPTRQKDEEKAIKIEEPTDRAALLTGLVQGSSVLPGLSRSGVTVSALLMQKIDKETALRFSFLMSAPAVLGILALEFLTGSVIPAGVGVSDLVIAEAITFAIGLASMEFLLRLARKINFWALCLILGLIAIVFGIPALFAVG